MLPANEIQQVIEVLFDFCIIILHTTAQRSSSTTRFICRQCARGLLCLRPSTARGSRVAGAVASAVSTASGAGPPAQGRSPGVRRRRGLLRSAGAGGLGAFASLAPTTPGNSNNFHVLGL